MFSDFSNFISQHILSLLIFFPIFGSIVLFCLPNTANNSKGLKLFAFAIVFLEFVFSLHLVFNFVLDSYHFQFSFLTSWLPLPGVNYAVGLDGLSLCLVLMTTTLSLIVFLSSQNVRGLLACFLFLEGTLIGALTSLDLFLFYFFWEASLIPLYFMIGIWGGKDRIYATLKFFVYGVAGSLLMLIAFIYLYSESGRVLSSYSANFLDIYRTAALLPFSVQCLLFGAMTLAFVIKIPLFPFYTWLPDTYEQAPPIYTMMSGVSLKLAAYGLVRLSLCAFPLASERYGNSLLALGVVSILYGALIAWRQTNLRRIMAFSSLSHMGFIVIGIFAFNTMAMQGALYQMINHSITAAAFFILFYFLETNYKTLEINDLGGLAARHPWFGFFFGIVAMSAVGLPSTGSFLGEWLILIGVFQSSSVFGTIAVLGVIFGAVYVLWFTYKVIFGPLPNNTSTGNGVGARREERSVHYAVGGTQATQQRSNNSISSGSRVMKLQLSLLCAAIFILGFASNQIFQPAKPTLSHIQETVINKTPYQAQLMTNQNHTLVPLSGLH